jgi:hypothetical protein
MVDVKAIQRLLTRDYEFQTGYTIDPVTGEVSTRLGVKFLNPDLRQMAVKFDKVGGAFNCAFNALETLENSPRSVGGSFLANNNRLKDLKGGPQLVGGTYDCDHNFLESLVGAPEMVGRDFECSWNKLVDLKGAPRKVLGYFGCSMNPNLKTFEGGPQFVGRKFMAFDVDLDNLNGLPEQFEPSGEVVLDYKPHLPLLRLLNAPQIDVVGAPKEVIAILDAHLGQGKKGSLSAGVKLARAGYKGNARW